MIIHPEKLSNNGIIFKTDSLFNSLVCSEVDFWNFTFANGIHVNIVGGFWRLLCKGRIAVVSYDHKQQFGLPEPLDVLETATKMLGGKHLKEISILKPTGDLMLSISDGISIEIFITSSGYESYTFCFDNKGYVGGGSGEISIYDLPK